MEHPLDFTFQGFQPNPPISFLCLHLIRLIPSSMGPWLCFYKTKKEPNSITLLGQE
jgi:hypothetical protein